VLEREYRAEPTRAEPIFYRLAWEPSTPAVFPPRRLEFSEGHTLMARLYGAARRAEARRELDQAIALDPRQAEAWARRALLAPNADAGPCGDAERATVLDPSLPLGWIALGLCLHSHGTSSEMDRIEEVSRQLDGFANSAESQLVAALLYEARGVDDAALKAARSAARITPDFFYHQVVLSRLAARHKRPDEARVARTRALALAPEGLDPSTLELLLTQVPPRSGPPTRPRP